MHDLIEWHQANHTSVSQVKDFVVDDDYDVDNDDGDTEQKDKRVNTGIEANKQKFVNQNMQKFQTN